MAASPLLFIVPGKGRRGGPNASNRRSVLVGSSTKLKLNLKETEEYSKFINSIKRQAAISWWKKCRWCSKIFILNEPMSDLMEATHTSVTSVFLQNPWFYSSLLCLKRTVLFSCLNLLLFSSFLLVRVWHMRWMERPISNCRNKKISRFTFSTARFLRYLSPFCTYVSTTRRSVNTCGLFLRKTKYFVSISCSLLFMNRFYWQLGL